MHKAVNTKFSGVFIGKSPTNVIVATHIVDPSGVRWQIVTAFQGLFEQIDFAGRQRIPQQGHL